MTLVTSGYLLSVLVLRSRSEYSHYSSLSDFNWLCQLCLFDELQGSEILKPGVRPHTVQYSQPMMVRFVSLVMHGNVINKLKNKLMNYRICFKY